MKNNIQLYVFCALFLAFFIGQAQLKVGDPGVTVDQSKFDSDYPQMQRWANAGVIGGIPFISSFNKKVTINPGNSDVINAAIKAMEEDLSAGEKGLITLESGTYNINKQVNMKSNVSIRGISRSGVVCVINMTNKNAFEFNNISNSGLYTLTIRGSWNTPTYPWNYGISANTEFANDNTSVRIKNNSQNCWLDKITILNSADGPMRCVANHNTFRDLVIDGAKRKGGGAQGYFFIQGGDNLITGCKITHLRHISLQGGNVEYNVVYDNDFRQEVSFHSGDAGNNLIANNKITLPVDMPPLAAGDPRPSALDASVVGPIYFAIMGPWSNQHQNSAKPNFLYKNKCVQNNHNFGSNTPWSNNNNVYFGPKKIAVPTQERIDNFPVYSKGAPSSGTLYAVNLGGVVTPPASGDKIVHMRKRNNPGFAMDGGRGGSNGQNAKLWSSNTGNQNQQWVEISRGNNFYSYKKRNTNFCLDGGSGGSNGQNLKLWSCNSGNRNQHWKKINAGSGNFRLQKRNASNFSIDGGNGGSNGQNVKIWSSNSSNQNQQWIFTTIANGTTLKVNVDEVLANLNPNKTLVYPNPFKSNVTLVLKDDHEFNSVQLYNINGELHYTKEIQKEDKELQLLFGDLNISKGLYFLKLKGISNEEQIIKLIKE